MRRSLSVLACALLVFTSQIVRAQPGGIAVTPYLAPDARSQGMGRAFTAFAEGPFATWWNPGVLAMGDGIQATPFSYEELVPELGGVKALSFGVTAVRNGLGVGAHVGRVTIGDDQYDNYRDMTGMLGFGVDVMELARDRDAAPPRTHWGIGANVKVVDLLISPIGLNELDDSALDVDLGMIVITRIPIEPSDGARSDDRGFEFRAGTVLRSVFDNQLEFEIEGTNFKSPIGKSLTTGVGVEMDLVPHPRFGHVVSARTAIDWVAYLGEVDDVPDAFHYGVELTFLGMLSGRIGYIDDEASTIDAATYGGGLTYRFTGSPVTLSFDVASVPQSKFLDDRVEQFTVSGGFGFPTAADGR